MRSFLFFAELNYKIMKAKLGLYQLVLDVNVAVQVSLIVDLRLLVKKVEFGWGGVGLGGDGGGVLGHNHVKPNSVELT